MENYINLVLNINNRLITDEEGNKFYYLNDKLHRDNEPAIEMINGDKYWYQHGKLHRLDGPVIELANGDKQ